MPNLRVTPHSSGPPPFFEKYRLQKHALGEGRVGFVYLCNNKETKEEFAVKCMYCDESTTTEIDREIVGLKNVVGIPHILQYIDLFKNSTFYFLITDCCYGGELFDQITARMDKGGMLSEPECCLITYQCMTAVKAMHDIGIVHRDLKPENIMLRNKNDFSDMVVIDLGLSRAFTPGQKITSRVGSSYYSPPEVEKRCYDESCDVWSLGINLYVMMCGYPPFDGPEERDVYEAVAKGEFTFPKAEWGKRSVGGPSLITKMLNLDMAARPKPAEVLADPWIKAGNAHQEKVHRMMREGLITEIDKDGKPKPPKQKKGAKPVEKKKPTRMEAEYTPDSAPESKAPPGTSLDTSIQPTFGPRSAKKKGWFS